MTTPKELRADNTQPRNGMIALYTLASVAALIALKPLFDSYFDSMISTEVQEKVLSQPAVELEAIHERERVLLDETGVPMDRVRAQLARGRQAGPALIAPQPSTAVDAIKGWSSLPPFVHTANPHAVDPAVAAAAAAAAADEAAAAAAAAAPADAVLPPDAVPPADAAPPADARAPAVVAPPPAAPAPAAPPAAQP